MGPLRGGRVVHAVHPGPGLPGRLRERHPRLQEATRTMRRREPITWTTGRRTEPIGTRVPFAGGDVERSHDYQVSAYQARRSCEVLDNSARSCYPPPVGRQGTRVFKRSALTTPPVFQSGGVILQGGQVTGYQGTGPLTLPGRWGWTVCPVTCYLDRGPSLFLPLTRAQERVSTPRSHNRVTGKGKQAITPGGIRGYTCYLDCYPIPGDRVTAFNPIAGKGLALCYPISAFNPIPFYKIAKKVSSDDL